MSLDFLSNGQPWVVLEHEQAILLLSAYSISPIFDSKDTPRIGFGLRRMVQWDSTAWNLKLQSRRLSWEGSPEDSVCWHWPGLVYRKSLRKVLSRKPCLLLSRTRHIGTSAQSGSTGSKHRETSLGQAHAASTNHISHQCGALSVVLSTLHVLSQFNHPNHPTILVLSFPIFRWGPELTQKGNSEAAMKIHRPPSSFNYRGLKPK